MDTHVCRDIKALQAITALLLSRVIKMRDPTIIKFKAKIDLLVIDKQT